MRAVRPLIQTAIHSQRPLLQTNVGGMLGNYVQVSDGQQISAFLSVPFAQPPVNQLRFEVV
jgi:carboxylesterase type B